MMMTVCGHSAAGSRSARGWNAALAGLLLAASTPSPVAAAGTYSTGALSRLQKRATIDPRYQSYNIEMVQITGGRFWAPYGGPAGETHRYRAPIDLANPRLRALAAHLSPAYVRVSGTWANTTYVTAKNEAISAPPTGFGQILTRAQWQGVIDFSKALDAPLVTSFAASAGTRDAQGRWTIAQADRLLEMTLKGGGQIHAAEFINEPALIGPGGLPKDYASTTYGRDFRTFAHWARRKMPATILLGPGNLGEETVDPVIAARMMAPGDVMSTARLLDETAVRLGAVSWHFYGGVSPRCGGGKDVSSREAALTAAWLDRTLIEFAAMSRLRDRHAPGKPLWLTETAQAACGGSPWASGFRDSFRYLNQLGQLARRGVKVVMHNTLAASDYGLIDPETFDPRPNYWAAVLWRQTMGPVVLHPPPAEASTLRVFAHCLPSMNGGVGLMVLNPGDAPQTFDAGQSGRMWLLRADDLDAGPVTVNGTEPRVAADGVISGLSAVAFKTGFAMPPRTIAFATVTEATNPRCLRS